MTTDHAPNSEPSALADLFFSFMPTLVDHINKRLAEHDMTNTDLWAVRSIDGPMPMKELAHCMEFDPSYVTVVADRLEARGLVTREPHPTDRRIKNLVLTPKGEDIKRTLPLTIWEGDNVFAPLTDEDRATLASLLTRLAPADPPERTEG